jgi:glycine cleavage system H protein
MNAPANLKYTKSDEWFDPASGKAGISDYAQSQLSDIVFVEILVDEGDSIEAGKAIASVESVKASAEIFAWRRQSFGCQQGPGQQTQIHQQ